MHSDTPGTETSETDTSDGSLAASVTISYPADLSDWSRDQLDGRIFRAYLRRKLDRPAVGDEWEEFVDVGCCGSAHHVQLRIEAVEGGDRVGEETLIEYTTRDACHVGGGWEVQSRAGPATE
ncbi:hypothetical protein [Salinirubrum litoreum]|uniref:DUF7968 domain-containing protein n=1 Tax=Salinirubrum litoreum TaxID=1126234 RepID=A0ABD5RDE5_9EURY|nr:hypothetical protein [Salinirubrum litoreum]